VAFLSLARPWPHWSPAPCPIPACSSASAWPSPPRQRLGGVAAARVYGAFRLTAAVGLGVAAIALGPGARHAVTFAAARLTGLVSG
jgi:hypothetical protein